MNKKNMNQAENERTGVDANRDTLSGEKGSHPVGTGVGTAMGGALTGVAAGAVAGPVGAVVGAVVGGIAGAYAGKSVAEQIDPTVEDAFWRAQYRSRDYYQANVDYDLIAPVYRYGWEFQDSGKYDRMSDAEAEARTRWENEGGADLPWDNVRPAFRDSWERAKQRQTPKIATDRTK